MARNSTITMGIKRLNGTTRTAGKRLAVPSLTGAEIYAIFRDTGPDAFGVGEGAVFHLDQGRCHLGRRAGIQASLCIQPTFSG